MKKILLVNLGREYGGAEKVIENIFFEDIEGMEIHLTTLKGNKLDEIITKSKKGNYIALDNDKKSFFKIIKKMKLYVEKNNIDIIHAHGVTSEIVSTIVAKITKRKLITTIHSRADYDIKNKIKGKLYIKIQKYLFKFNEKYILVSDDLKKFFLKEGLLDNKLLVIKNGIKELKKRKVINNFDTLNLCTIGRLTEVKRHSNLIKALIDLNKSGIKINCLIAGTGELEKELKDLVNQAGLSSNIKFLGFVNDVRDVFDKSNIMIIQSDMEGLPIVLLEAMSYKLPIITHNIGGIKSVLNDNTAVLLNDNNVETIKNSLLKIFNENLDLTNKANQAYLTFKNEYDLKIFLEKHIHLYRSL